MKPFWNGLLAVSFLLFGGLLTANAQPVKTITTDFEVTIHQRANPTDEPFSVIGVLSMDIEEDGSFTGSITPYKDDTGRLFPGVLYTGKSMTLAPDSPTKLDVFGQANGRSISIAIKLPNNKVIFGTGTARDNLNKMQSGQLTGFVGGSAVTSDSGERGDWIAYKLKIEIVPCPAGCKTIFGEACVVCFMITGYIEF